MSNQLTLRDQAQQIGEIMLSGKFRENLSQSMGVKSDDPVIDRFARVAMRAIQSDPKLLTADRQSLFLACQDAATDGLMPDGRQGKLMIYSTKQGNQWIDKVQWMRMIGGLRTLAADRDFDLIAYPVHEADDFDYQLGGAPRIDHKPARGDRGQITEYYAIATHLTTGRQYFEVMSAAEVDGIMGRTKSRDKAGNIVGPWKSDKAEMGRKTVSKRLFKSLPFAEDDEAIQAFIRRDNEEYESTAPRRVMGPSTSTVAQLVNEGAAALEAPQSPPEADPDEGPLPSLEVVDEQPAPATAENTAF